MKFIGGRTANVGMLVMSVSLLKSVRFERLDAGLLLTEGVPDEKDTTAVRFIEGFMFNIHRRTMQY